jgi:hypothetical protein
MLLALLVGGASHCAASEYPRLVERDGKRLICMVQSKDTLSGDCGTESYDAVFTAKILAVEQVSDSRGRNAKKTLGAIYASDLRLTVEPEEVFKGHPPHEVQIFAKQGECFAGIRIGGEWLFFGERGTKTNGLEISYPPSNYPPSNPSGPVEQRLEYIKRLRRLERGDGLSYVVGGVEYPSPSYDSSIGFQPTPRPNHRLLIKSEDGKQSYPVATDVEGRFELGPVAPGSFSIDANTDSRFQSDTLNRAVTRANGCSFVTILLDANGEISGRVILPEVYLRKISESHNDLPLFSVEIDTLDGEAAAGSSMGEGLTFTVRGLPPATYIVQLVYGPDEPWLRMPVYAPGVTDKSTALRVNLGLAERKAGLEIRVPPEALKAAK